MGVIAKPFTFAPGVAVSSQVNSDFDTIYNEFNGNIDNANIKAGAAIDAAKLLDASITNAKLANNMLQDGKIDRTSVKLLSTGAAAMKMARGSKAFALVAGGHAGLVVTFSTDSDDGNPGFVNTPRITLGGFCTTGNLINYKVTARSNTSFTLQVNGTGAETGEIMWMAVGI